jgi:hypothetical protein
MNDAGIAGNGGDALTRTTLQIGGIMSDPLIAAIVRALQRVPGVLLVDMDATSARVIVAHDGAVPLGALVTAATGAGGLAARVHGAAPVANASVSSIEPDDRVRRYRRAIVIAALAVTFVLADLFIPGSMPKRIVMTAVLVGAWTYYIAGTFTRRQH